MLTTVTKSRTALLALSIITGSVLVGCGAQQAGTTVPPASTASTSSSGPTADEDTPPPLPTEDLPTLQPQTEASLDALSPPDTSGMRGKAANDDAESVTLSQLYRVRPCSTVAAWLGIDLPDMSTLTKAGYSETCATDWTEDTLPARGGVNDAGEPVEVTSYVWYAPSDVNVEQVSAADVVTDGIASISIYSGPNIWPPANPQNKNPENPAGGAVSLTTPDGPVVGIQNKDPYTRIAWLYDRDGKKYNITAAIPAAPAEAYRLILATENT